MGQSGLHSQDLLENGEAWHDGYLNSSSPYESNILVLILTQHWGSSFVTPAVLFP